MNNKQLLNSQYLFFSLENEIYAVDAKNVQEITDSKTIKYIPKSHKAIKGITNIRGELIPLIDSKNRLDLGTIEFSKRTSFIIFKTSYNDKDLHIGMIVDLVIEVEEINQNDILEKPEFGTKVNERFVKNVIRYKDNYITVLNINNFFDIKELSQTQLGE